MTRCLDNDTLLDLQRRRIAVFSKLETGVAKILQQSVALKVLPSNIALRRVCRFFMLNIPQFSIPALCKFTVKRVHRLSSLPNAL